MAIGSRTANDPSACPTGFGTRAGILAYPNCCVQHQGCAAALISMIIVVVAGDDSVRGASRCPRGFDRLFAGARFLSVRSAPVGRRDQA